MKRFISKRTALTCSVLFLLLWGVLHAANGDELEEIRKAIREKGAKWTAGETSISRLPAQERRSRAGAILSGEEHEGEKLRPEVLPERFDWRLVCTENNYVTTIKDQEACGSCWAFATVGMLESLELIIAETPDPPGEDDLVDRSEQFLVSCNKRNNGCGGGRMDYAYNFVKWIGVPDEDCFPYKAKDLPCFLHCRDWQDRRVKIDSWSWVARDVEALKAAVYENPVAACFYVYTDFYSYTEGVYEYTWGDFEGGHAVLLIGWDDNPPEGIPCFICKNSWGIYWGEPGPSPEFEPGGYFRIGYSQVENKVSFGSDTGDFDMVPMLAPPMTPGPGTATTVWGRIKSSI